MHSELFRTLHIQPKNPGAYGRKIGTSDSKFIASRSPTTGQELAKIGIADEASYNSVISDAQEVFLEWRKVPAPERGALVREIGNALRDLREPLGKLISLETGKILQEGIGEVQEAIDIADFSVGLSRYLVWPYDAF